MIGTITSADWGHRVKKNLAMAFVDPAFAEIGTQVEVDVVGLPVKARVIEPCPYDAENELVR